MTNKCVKELLGFINVFQIYDPLKMAKPLAETCCGKSGIH
jgi:hypothetical protein